MMEQILLRTGLILLFSLLWALDRAHAIERVAVTGAREAALGNASVAVPGHFSLFSNPALLSGWKEMSVSMTYRQPNQVSNYHEMAVGLIIPIPATVFGLGICQSGIASCRETSYGISISKNLARKCAAGLLFNYYAYNFPEAGQSRGSFQVDGGFSYSVATGLLIGIHLQNFLSTKIETFQYRFSFPFHGSAGAACQLSENILLTGQAGYQKENGCSLHTGSEIILTNSFSIRAGISTRPFRHAFGFGFHKNSWQLDFAMVHHEILGMTSEFSFSFHLIK